MKKIFFTLLHKLQLTRLAAWCNRKRVIILCYHGVTERASRHPDDPSGLHIRADRFEAQLDYLRRHYRVISLAKFLEARRTNARHLLLEPIKQEMPRRQGCMSLKAALSLVILVGAVAVAG